MEIQGTTRCHLTPARKAVVKNRTDSELWRRCGQKGAGPTEAEDGTWEEPGRTTVRRLLQPGSWDETRDLLTAFTERDSKGYTVPRRRILGVCSPWEEPGGLQSMGGAWWAAVHGVAEGWTRLSDFTFTFHFQALEKEMAAPSSVLAWRIPGTGEPGGLPSMESHRVGQD